MTTKVIDLNSDIGELKTENNDHEIVRLVTSVNISCGVHAGSAELTKATLLLAKNTGVAIGAHPGLGGGFGRDPSPIDPAFANGEMIRQLTSFASMADRSGVTASHVKPHGTLYTQAEQNPSLADAIINAVSKVFPKTVLFGLAGGHLLERAASNGLVPISEFFADRNYLPNGTLVPRTSEKALIHDPLLVAQRTTDAVRSGEIVAIDDTVIKIRFQTICVHGDTLDSVAMIKKIRSSLLASNIQIKAVQ